jgi:hypothetical protein
MLLALSGAVASAEPWHSDSETHDPTLDLGDSQWQIYRPKLCAQEIYDLGYLATGLRAAKPGFGLRFRSGAALTIELRFDPITDRQDFIGPIYDRHIGATTLSFAVNF